MAGGLIASRLPRVIDFIEREMAFVGLLEEWEKTICLFHASFGGPLFAAELMNVRPTAGNGGRASQYNESELGDVLDAADQAVYAAAKRRFERDVRDHHADISQCLRRTTAIASSLPSPSFTSWAHTAGQRFRSVGISFPRSGTFSGTSA